MYIDLRHYAMPHAAQWTGPQLTDVLMSRLNIHLTYLKENCINESIEYPPTCNLSQRKLIFSTHLKPSLNTIHHQHIILVNKAVYDLSDTVQ